MKPEKKDYRLYLVTDPVLNRDYSVLEQIEMSIRGGLKVLQIREKSVTDEAFIDEASQALEITRRSGAYLIVNDRADIAAQVGADGVHLGQSDMPLKEARKIYGDDLIIGISVKSPEEAKAAEGDGADYIAVNGVFHTDTKKDLGALPGLEGLRKISESVSLPVIGIGGINLDNCADVIDAGADGIAVVTAITMVEDIPSACRKFLEKIDTAFIKHGVDTS